ncbi:Multidrug-efflux transporter [Raoultella terrigena]|uniref:Multidrug-efflux transporter n=1 Tax=Raoultella terrigena TaxID=577 RepID=A0A3P8JJA9_RAOTE|nr:Multidrug-efflux transporter [Raoultella terrigena]
MAAITAIFTILMRKQIALLYNDNPEVVVLASQLMLLAAIYQISDSVQVIGSGILRGYKDTRSIFFITFTAYWVLGLPSGYVLALTDMVVPRMGPAGFWCGFIIGLTSAAILMMPADALPPASAVERHFTARSALTGSGAPFSGRRFSAIAGPARAQRLSQRLDKAFDFGRSSASCRHQHVHRPRRAGKPR